MSVSRFVRRVLSLTAECASASDAQGGGVHGLAERDAVPGDARVPRAGHAICAVQRAGGRGYNDALQSPRE